MIRMRYFFRDLCDEENLSDGKSYHAAGIVECRYGDNGISGKDMSVVYIEPFTGNVVCGWRALNEVEMFEVTEDEYIELEKFIESVDKLSY